MSENIFVVACNSAQVLRLLIAAGIMGFHTVGKPPEDGERLFFDMDNENFGAESIVKPTSLARATQVDFETMMQVLVQHRKDRNSEKLNAKGMHDPSIEVEFEDYDGHRGLYGICVPCARKALQGDNDALEILFENDRAKRMFLAQFLIANGFPAVDPVEVGRRIHEQVERAM